MYHANNTAWMTCNVFKLWLKAFVIQVSGRKFILILDNCSAHIKEEDLEDAEITLQNATLLNLPPNATSKIPPCDAGNIRSFKAYYRRRFKRQLLDHLKKNQPDSAKINFLEAIHMAHAACTRNVQPECIRNCFTHCKLRTSDMDSAANANVEVPQAVVADLQGKVQQLYRNMMSIDFLLNNPDEEQVSYTPTEAQIIGSV